MMTQDPTLFLAPVEDDTELDDVELDEEAPSYDLVQKALDFGDDAAGPLTHPRIPGIQLWLVNITPDRAANFMLLNSKDQRNKADSTRNTYADDMADHAWLFLGDPIRFDKGFVLIDGQHRLDAVIRSGEAQLMAVITGLAVGAMRWVDVGRKRSFADLLRMHHEISQHSAVGSVVRSMEAWDAGYYGDRSIPRRIGNLNFTRPSNGKLDQVYLNLLASGHDPVKAVRAAQQVKFHIASTTQASALGIAWMLFSRVDSYARDQFFERVMDRIGGADQITRSTYAPNLLRSRMARSTYGSSEKLPRQVWLHMIVTSWNLWRAGREVETLSRPRAPITAATWAFPDGLEDAIQ